MKSTIDSGLGDYGGTRGTMETRWEERRGLLFQNSFLEEKHHELGARETGGD